MERLNEQPKTVLYQVNQLLVVSGSGVVLLTIIANFVPSSSLTPGTPPGIDPLEALTNYLDGCHGPFPGSNIIQTLSPAHALFVFGVAIGRFYHIRRPLVSIESPVHYSFTALIADMDCPTAHSFRMTWWGRIHRRLNTLGRAKQMSN